MISPHQSGFRKGRGTLDPIICLETEIRKAQVNEESVMAVFFDVDKAYDMVWSSGPQTTARGPDTARLHVWSSPLNNTRKPTYDFFFQSGHANPRQASQIAVDSRAAPPSGRQIRPTVALGLVMCALSAPPPDRSRIIKQRSAPRLFKLVFSNLQLFVPEVRVR